jgi:hypothetical protein
MTCVKMKLTAGLIYLVLCMNSVKYILYVIVTLLLAALEWHQ